LGQKEAATFCTATVYYHDGDGAAVKEKTRMLLILIWVEGEEERKQITV
jgi:hypothetical protein